MKQVRAPITDIEKNVYDMIYRGKSFDDAGKGI
jgi:hypothetical protein